MSKALRRTAGSGIRRIVPAGVTALATALLVAPLPGPSAAVATTATPPLTTWEAITGTDTNEILAPGVEHFRYQEAAPPPGDLRHGKPRRELNVLRIDPAKGALRIESSYGRAAGDAEIVRDQLNANKNLPVAGINGSFFSPEGRHAQAAVGEEESVQSYGATVRDGVLLGAACNPDKTSRRSSSSSTASRTSRRCRRASPSPATGPRRPADPPTGRRRRQPEPRRRTGLPSRRDGRRRRQGPRRPERHGGAHVHGLRGPVDDRLPGPDGIRPLQRPVRDEDPEAGPEPRDRLGQLGGLRGRRRAGRQSDPPLHLEHRPRRQGRPQGQARPPSRRYAADRVAEGDVRRRCQAHAGAEGHRHVRRP